MFEAQETPRIFALGLGVDFPKALVKGVLDRTQNNAPTDIAQIQIIVNTARMRRRVSTLFIDGKGMRT